MKFDENAVDRELSRNARQDWPKHRRPQMLAKRSIGPS